MYMIVLIEEHEFHVKICQERHLPAMRFHSLTPAYDIVVRFTTRERTFREALVRQAAPQPGQRLLDLACGTGTLTIQLKQACPDAEVVAVDRDARVLAIARGKARLASVAIQFDEGVSYELPYPDGRFDLVTSSLFFHHLSWGDKKRTAREVFRVLRPGGEFHVADFGRARGFLMRAASLLLQLFDGLENTRDNLNGRLPELFENAGFLQVRETQTLATPIGTLALYRAVRYRRGSTNARIRIGSNNEYEEETADLMSINT